MSRPVSGCSFAFAVKCLIAAQWLLGAHLTRADTGVSDGRVSFPDGPGSIGGMGENVSASGSMGGMTYQVPLDLPTGFAGATPELSLDYSSLEGSGELGIGWMLPIPHIERFTRRGLPSYDSDDLFAADGHDELVRVSSDSKGKHTFRARFEGGFLRYTWHADTRGAAGYWEAEYPDGLRAYFGADATGTTVKEARATGPAGQVFRYMLVETVDRFDHRVRYHYRLDGTHPLLAEIQYLFLRGQPRYLVKLDYEARSDALSNGLPGFELRLSHRLSAVTVSAREVEGPGFYATLRRYVLRYHDTPIETSVGTSQLAAVEHYGSDGSLHPVRHTFEYSASLELGCKDCRRPFVYSMGQLEAGANGGVDLRNGLSTLIDINGDALPDLLDTDRDGRHRFFLNTMAADGKQTFQKPTLSRRTEDGSRFVLDAPGVQAVDLNGDGFTDLIHAASGETLCNRGEGDWTNLAAACGELSLSAALTDNPAESGEADPLGMRFFDYDGDKRMDLLHTTPSGESWVWHNTPGGFEASIAQPLEKAFDVDALQLADVNGDGLLDPVEVTATGSVWYRLNLGHGRWSGAFVQQLAQVPGSLPDAELQDLNGDGLDDVVVVRARAVHFALNRAGLFLPFQALQDADVDGGLPTKSNDTSVLYADMNGSGTIDVVWVQASGQVQALELFALRPNLLTAIHNGIGGEQRVEYGTSVREQVRDALAPSPLPWRYQLPQAMNLVTATELFTKLTPEVRLRVERLYHHGVYDGLEKRYRGFEQVEEHTPGDATEEPAYTKLDYDTGYQDPYRVGLLLREQVFGGEELRPIRKVLYMHEDCPLEDVSQKGHVPVRFVCETATETLLQEKRPEPEWVRLRSERSYDGYGNVTRTVDLGVVGLGKDGAAGCAPCSAPGGAHSGACGAECLGDEQFVETEYIAPGKATQGAWILGRPSRSIGYGEASGPHTETLSYYDGQPFVGLQRGLVNGLLTRQCQRVRPDAPANCDGGGWVQSLRVQYDDHGNVIAELDPLGAPGDESGHQRRIEYDVYGVQVIAVTLLLSMQGTPYQLRQEVLYHPLFDQPTSVTPFMLQAGPLGSERGETRFDYDAFGRRSKIAQPGDTLQAPTEAFAYELSDPVSRVVVTTRTTGGQAADLEQIKCVDGFGRTVQTRTRLSEGHYQVTGFHDVNPQGSPVRAYQGYQGGAQCDRARPENVPFQSYTYDAVGRALRVTEPDATLYGEASVTRYEYAPLATTTFDAEDNDPESPHHNTPDRSFSDGLGRVVRMERVLEVDGEAGPVRALWDSLGRLVGYVDPGGHHKRQSYDLLGRVLSVDDPNAGRSEFTYDAASNLTLRIDARGSAVVTEYDGANRPVAQFERGNREATEVHTRYDFAADCEGCAHTEGRVARTRYPLGDQQGSDEYAYDLRGREVSLSRTLSGHRFVLRAEYDHGGRRTATVYPDGTTLQRRHDGGSRLSAIEGFVSHIDYDAHGRLSQVALANGQVSTRQYNIAGRLVRRDVIARDGVTLYGVALKHDRVGNLLALRDTSDARPGRPHFGLAAEYDAWYRLRRLILDSGGDQEETLHYGYDKLDNMRSVESSFGASSPVHLGKVTYAAERPNAVVSAGELDVTTDMAGAVVRRGDTVLEHDYLGRIVSAENPTRGEHLRYFYDPTGRLAMRTGTQGVSYYVGSHFEMHDGMSQVYVQIGSEIVARRRSMALATTVFADLSGKDGIIDIADAWFAGGEGDASPFLRASARRLLLESGDSHTYFVSDEVQSLILATDSTGAVRGERAYYPFGQPRVEAGYLDERGFGGQVHEASGFVRYRFRSLDPLTGRFDRPDPLFAVASIGGLAQSGEATTGYAFVANNTLNSFDPTGLARHGGRSLPSVRGIFKGAGQRLGRVPWAKVARVAGEAAVGAAMGAAFGALFGGPAGAVVGAISGGIALGAKSSISTPLDAHFEARGQTMQGAIRNHRLANVPGFAQVARALRGLNCCVPFNLLHHRRASNSVTQSAGNGFRNALRLGGVRLGLEHFPYFTALGVLLGIGLHVVAENQAQPTAYQPLVDTGPVPPRSRPSRDEEHAGTAALLWDEPLSDE